MKLFPRYLQAVSMALGLCALLGALLRVILINDVEKKVDVVTLEYLGAAAGLFFLPRLKSFGIGGTKIELQGAVELAKTASSMALNLAPAESRERIPSMLLGADSAQRGGVPDDPWKSVFGGLSESNGRRIEASVHEVPGDDQWFMICLVVTSTDKSFPLPPFVQFFLHDSFANDKPVIEVVDGRAELRLLSWGAFTVGVLCDDGKTRLELDLAEDKSFPALFRSR